MIRVTERFLLNCNQLQVIFKHDCHVAATSHLFNRLSTDKQADSIICQIG